MKYEESNLVELKRSLNDDMIKEVIAFLNSYLGGTIYVGINDDGSFYNPTQEEKDLILVALFLHDGQKQGKREGNTVFDHPIHAANFVKQCHIETDLLNDDQMQLIYDCIATHMGQWNTAKYSKVVLPMPKTKYQKFVHLCDYLASRKFLEMNFEKV